MSETVYQPVVIGDTHRDVWDSLVALSPNANSFLRSNGLDLITATDSYGTRFHRVGVFDKAGAMRGAWALPYRIRAGVRYSTYFEFFYAGPFLHPELETGSVHFARERMEVLQALAAGQTDYLDIIEAETHPAMHDIRPFLYAGWKANPLYTHVWDMADPGVVWNSMNREKRRMIRRAAETLRFAFEGGEPVINEFLTIYRSLITKFNWVPLPRWDNDMQRRLTWLADQDTGRIFTARSNEGQLKAAVIALLSRDDRTAYLWRSAYHAGPDSQAVVPALYWRAAAALREEWGEPLLINFGGSPRLSLTTFKDYLGARPVLHFRLIHNRPGLKTSAWHRIRHWKETARGIATRGGLLESLYRRTTIP